jgi:hypothetical protein
LLEYEDLLNAYELLKEEYEESIRAGKAGPQVTFEAHQPEYETIYGDDFSSSHRVITSIPTYTVTITYPQQTYTFESTQMRVETRK